MNTTIKTLATAALAAFTFGFTPSAQAYNILIDEQFIENGRVWCDQTTAEEGQQVVLYADPEPGFQLTGIWARGASSWTEYEVTEGEQGHVLVMPAEDVIIQATFQQPPPEETTLTYQFADIVAKM